MVFDFAARRFPCSSVSGKISIVEALSLGVVESVQVSGASSNKGSTHEVEESESMSGSTDCVSESEVKVVSAEAEVVSAESSTVVVVVVEVPGSTGVVTGSEVEVVAESVKDAGLEFPLSEGAAADLVVRESFDPSDSLKPLIRLVASEHFRGAFRISCLEEEKI